MLNEGFGVEEGPIGFYDFLHDATDQYRAWSMYGERFGSGRETRYGGYLTLGRPWTNGSIVG